MKVSPLTKTIIGLTAAGAAYVWVQKKRNEASLEVARPIEIHGFVSSGYEAVRVSERLGPKGSRSPAG